MTTTLEAIARRFLTWFAKAAKLPKRVIARDEGDVYLNRYYLLGEPGGLKYFPEDQREMRWWQKPLARFPLVYLHHFERSDEDESLHNHPWEAKALILAGGYLEERRVLAWRRTKTGFEIDEKICRPGTVNRLNADTFHRVRLLQKDCWTLIVVGKKVQTWGFWNPRTGEFLNHREHRARIEAGVTAKGGQA